MPVEKWTPERRRALTRTALLDAAAEVFAERGYQGASLDEIAEAAGFTRGAIYSNFDGKEDLFLRVMERRNDELFQRYADLLEDAPDGETVVDDASLHDIADLWSTSQAGDDIGLRLLLEFRLLALRSEPVRQRLAEFERQTEDTVAQLVERLHGRTGLNLRIPVADFATLLYACQQGLQQHIATCSGDHKGLFETLLQLLVPAATEPAPPRRG
jgi:AcrR family transcriptional regulator